MKIVNEYYRKMAPSGKENRTGNSLLFELERDHRNLVKHCLNMEEEIKYNVGNKEITSNKWTSSMR